MRIRIDTEGDGAAHAHEGCRAAVGQLLSLHHVNFFQTHRRPWCISFEELCEHSSAFTEITSTCDQGRLNSNFDVYKTIDLPSLQQSMSIRTVSNNYNSDAASITSQTEIYA